MTNAPRPIPLRPRPEAPAAQSIERAAFAIFAAFATRDSDAAAILAKHFPGDDLAGAVLKAATAPADTTTPGWVADLAARGLSSFLPTLAPLSAIAAIMSRGVFIDQAGLNGSTFPLRSGDPVARPWVRELEAFPVTNFNLIAGLLAAPSKIGAIVVASRDLTKRTEGPGVFATLLREDAARSLDSAYLNASAASSEAQQGLLYGVTPLTGFIGGGPEAVSNDLGDLASKVGTGGSGQVVFIMSPARFARLPIVAPMMRVEALPSLAVADDQVIAIDPASLVHGTSGAPDIVVSKVGMVHMSDDPSAVLFGAAAPIRSIWQTDAIATRLIVDICYAKRRPGAVAALNGASW